MTQHERDRTIVLTFLKERIREAEKQIAARDRICEGGLQPPRGVDEARKYWKQTLGYLLRCYQIAETRKHFNIVA